MSPVWIAFFVGLVIGAAVCIICLTCLFIAGEADEEAEALHQSRRGAIRKYDSLEKRP